MRHIQLGFYRSGDYWTKYREDDEISGRLELEWVDPLRPDHPICFEYTDVIDLVVLCRYQNFPTKLYRNHRGIR